MEAKRNHRLSEEKEKAKEIREAGTAAARHHFPHCHSQPLPLLVSVGEVMSERLALSSFALFVAKGSRAGYGSRGNSSCRLWILVFKSFHEFLRIFLSSRLKCCVDDAKELWSAAEMDLFRFTDFFFWSCSSD